MDLILWRHAEAQDCHKDSTQTGGGGHDMGRPLTPRSEKQAACMTVWLDRQFPEGVRIMVSPAHRCGQTALDLGRKYKIRAELAPDADPAQLLELLQWPHARLPLLVIGHQPRLGQTIAQLLGLQKPGYPVKKCALWWLLHQEGDGHSQTVVVTVQSPQVL